MTKNALRLTLCLLIGASVCLTAYAKGGGGGRGGGGGGRSSAGSKPPAPRPAAPAQKSTPAEPTRSTPWFPFWGGSSSKKCDDKKEKCK